jgi:hypothetical protein
MQKTGTKIINKFRGILNTLSMAMCLFRDEMNLALPEKIYGNVKKSGYTVWYESFKNKTYGHVLY